MVEDLERAVVRLVVVIEVIESEATIDIWLGRVSGGGERVWLYSSDWHYRRVGMEGREWAAWRRQVQGA